MIWVLPLLPLLLMLLTIEFLFWFPLWMPPSLVDGKFYAGFTCITTSTIASNAHNIVCLFYAMRSRNHRNKEPFIHIKCGVLQAAAICCWQVNKYKYHKFDLKRGEHNNHKRFDRPWANRWLFISEQTKSNERNACELASKLKFYLILSETTLNSSIRDSHSSWAFACEPTKKREREKNQTGSIWYNIYTHFSCIFRRCCCFNFGIVWSFNSFCAVFIGIFLSLICSFGQTICFIVSCLTEKFKL